LGGSVLNMKKIAIIGASYLQLPLVKKAIEMGLETHVFAWKESAVCKEFADYFYPISILDKEIILDKCREVSIDGIVTIASDAAVSTVSYVAENMGLVSNSYFDALATTNKYEMRKKFLENDVSSPNFILAVDESTEFDLKFPVIVKPVDRSGSRGISKVCTKADLGSAIKRAQTESFSGKVIVEEYVEGDEVSVETISWEGKHYILAITDKVTTGEPYFVELAHHQPSSLDLTIQTKVKIETIKALNSLNVKFGASHSEFKITNAGDVYAIEVGARMGGDFIGSDLVYLSTGYDYLKGVIEIALGEFKAPTLNVDKYSGIYFLSSETKHLKHFIIDNKLPQIIKSEITNSKISFVQSSGERSGYLIYNDDKKLEI
jgi:biotin carboxylase